MGANKLGRNIRALRTAYGETQQDLGDAIHVEKNTISNYEKGNREPDRETLLLIAQHYSVSIEELTHADFSELGKITIDKNAFWNNIDVIFPIVSTDNALMNDDFKTAYNAQKRLYDQLKKQRLDDIDYLEECFEGYVKAFDDETIKCETAANYLSIWYLFISMLKMAPVPLKRRTASMMQVANKDPMVMEILENSDPEFERESREMLREIYDSNVEVLISEMKTVLKRSTKWNDLGDYYLALQYVYNIVDNDLGWEFNQRIGAEMMNAFVSVGNVYSARFIKFNYEAVGKEFTD